MFCNAWLEDEKRYCAFHTRSEDELLDHERKAGHEAEDLSPEWTIS